MAFEALPGSFLLLEPDAPRFTILAVSDELLSLTARNRPEVVGNSVFDVYPENPEAVTATGPSNLRVSLQNATRTKQPDQMPVVRYDVSNAEGIFEARYWSAHTRPVLNQAGEVQYLIHSTEDITAQVQAENRERDLGKIEKSYSLFLQAPVGVYILMGPENVVELANDEMLRFLGATSAIVGQPLFQHLPPNAQDGLQQALDYVRKTGQPYYSTEYPITLLLNGQEILRYYNFVYQPYFDNLTSQTATGVFGVAHDVTEQVLARQRAEESEYRYRVLIEEAPIATALYVGPDIRIQYANPLMLNYWEKDGSVIGKTLLEALPELEDQPFPALLKQVYATGKPYIGVREKATLSVNGQLQSFYFNFTYKPLLNSEGEVYGVHHTATDVTEEVLTQQKISESESRFRNVVEQVTDPILILKGENLVLEMANEALFEIWQVGPEAVGKRFRDILPEMEGQVFEELLLGVLHTGKPFFGYQVPARFKRKNGEEDVRYFDFRYQPYREADGSVTGVLVVALDVTQQMATSQRLRESESRFRSMVEQSPVATTLTRGLDVVIENINTPMLRMMGKQAPDEVLGKPMVEILPHIESQAILDIAKTVTETGQAFRGNEIPIKMLGDNGELDQRYYNVSYTPLSEAGLVTGVIHVAIDVTEQVWARQKVEENSEELKRFKFMADQARDPFILMREDGSFAYLNNRALEAWGYTKEEAQHLRVPDVDAINKQEEFAQLFDQAQLKTIPQAETMHKRKDGLLFPVEVSLAGIILNEKPYLFAVARDITEKKKSTEALRESEERFRIMADATPNLVWAVHPDSTIRYVNKAFIDFVGVSMEEYAATGWSAYLPEEEFEFAQKTLTEAIRNRTIYSMEHRMRRKDGEYRWLLAQGAPSYYPNGEIYGYVGSAIDITELKQANEQLVRINNDLDNFVYTASHDLKAPISNIEGLLHALLRTPATESMKSEQVQVLLSMMQESVERFTKTIANLTDIVKLQKESNEETVQVQLAEVLEHVLLDLEALRASAGAHVEVDVAACPIIRFSAKNLRSVIYNLLSNAFKYRSPGRELRVQLQCSVTAEHHVLSVTDNGLGIESARIDQLFTMFKRFHDHVEGSGIGLYMVKKMVENVGGKIEVESEAGVGTTFRIYFPR